MKVEQAKQIAGNAIEQLRQALEAGHSEQLKEYLARWRASGATESHDLLVGQRNADRFAEAECDARRGLSRLAQAGPLRRTNRASSH